MPGSDYAQSATVAFVPGPGASSNDENPSDKEENEGSMREPGPEGDTSGDDKEKSDEVDKLEESDPESDSVVKPKVHILCLPL